MERNATIEEAREIFGVNIIGIDELQSISSKIIFDLPLVNPEIPYTKEFLNEKANEYILILGVSHFKNGEVVSIKTLRDLFGVEPEKSEPCFYNQDWYMNESFIKITLDQKWYLIRKEIIESTRGVNPELLNIKNFSSAILCTYSFFIYKLISGITLWKNEYIWCNDYDSNGDLIYVGRYNDLNGLSKNGFSIHRFLKINNQYASIG